MAQSLDSNSSLVAPDPMLGHYAPPSLKKQAVSHCLLHHTDCANFELGKCGSTPPVCLGPCPLLPFHALSVMVGKRGERKLPERKSQPPWGQPGSGAGQNLGTAPLGPAVWLPPPNPNLALGNVPALAGWDQQGPERFLGLPKGEEGQRAGLGRRKSCPAGTVEFDAPENVSECLGPLTFTECEVFRRHKGDGTPTQA